jgi:FixJ family two-component response regulator
MPGVPGEEVFRELRRRWPALPVVVMTGAGPEEAAARFAGSLGLHFLAKPFRFGELLDAVRLADG